MDYLIEVYEKEPVEKWEAIIANLDVPNNVRTLSAFTTAFLLFVVPNLFKTLSLTPVPTYRFVLETVQMVLDNEIIRERYE